MLDNPHMQRLLQPLEIGSLSLKNRVVMAPLTRCRAVGEDRIPNALMREYYGQRASAGLILTEATAISPIGAGYNHTPGIWTEGHIAGWRTITDEVHRHGGLIFLQLWHAGRMSDPTFLNGTTPVAPSAIAPEGHVKRLEPKRLFSVPRPLELGEVKSTIKDFRTAAENAKRAGFDGVELHGANGYLPDQFLQDSTNRRTDEYGGSLKNRARFMLEVTDELCDVWGPDRVGVHLSPRCDNHSMGDSDPAETFSYVARELGRRKIAFICSREYRSSDWLAPRLKKEFGGIYILNEKFTPESAEEALNSGEGDAVAFGRQFISNPDLPERIAHGFPLAEPDLSTFYTHEAAGYVDYPPFR